MPRWTQQDYDAYERKRKAGGPQPGPCPGDKKLDVCHREQKAPRLETAMRGKFRVSMHFTISDRRTRDLDGCASTILDALIACRRQLAGYTGDSIDGGSGA